MALAMRETQWFLADPRHPNASRMATQFLLRNFFYDLNANRSDPDETMIRGLSLELLRKSLPLEPEGLFQEVTGLPLELEELLKKVAVQ